jgi:hypothetical protein
MSITDGSIAFRCLCPWIGSRREQNNLTALSELVPIDIFLNHSRHFEDTQCCFSWRYYESQWIIRHNVAAFQLLIGNELSNSNCFDSDGFALPSSIRSVVWGHIKINIELFGSKLETSTLLPNSSLICRMTDGSGYRNLQATVARQTQDRLSYKVNFRSRSLCEWKISRERNSLRVKPIIRTRYGIQLWTMLAHTVHSNLVSCKVVHLIFLLKTVLAKRMLR